MHASPSSPAKVGSPTRTGSPKKDVTRYGPIHLPDSKFGGEKRFQWQDTAEGEGDAIYDLPTMTMTRSVLFGHSIRKGMDDENPDSKKRSTGPGSYDVEHSHDHLSEYISRKGNMFSCAARKGMDVKTPSPGAVYNIEKKYWNGVEKSGGTTFSQATRQNPFDRSIAKDAELFFPKPDMGPSITIAGKHSYKLVGCVSPGPVYDVHVSSSLSLSSPDTKSKNCI
jgi:hypothetical protein